MITVGVEYLLLDTEFLYLTRRVPVDRSFISSTLRLGSVVLPSRQLRKGDGVLRSTVTASTIDAFQGNVLWTV